MLSRLLEGVELMDAASLEETRMRASQLLSKVCRYSPSGAHWVAVVTHPSMPTSPSSPSSPLLPPLPHPSFLPLLTTSPQVFLQHLSPLLKLGNFQELWLGILGVLEKYCLIKDSDSLVGGGVGVVTSGRVSALPYMD